MVTGTCGAPDTGDVASFLTVEIDPTEPSPCTGRFVTHVNQTEHCFRGPVCTTGQHAETEHHGRDPSVLLLRIPAPAVA
ncbi:MAG: hypothetical protein ACRDTH_04600 [Pseudonocardiaceae bacterium]